MEHSTVPYELPSELRPEPTRVAVLADSDTRWKWGVLTARRLAPAARIDGMLLRGRATPTPRQLDEVGVPTDALREVTSAEFVHAVTDGTGAGACAYDAVVLACVGGAVQAMLHGIAAALRHTPVGQGDAAPRHRRPVLVTGYVGVVYEKLADGLLLRHGADVVLANSPADAARFRAVYAGVGADAAAVTECALPFLDGTRVAAGKGGTDGGTEDEGAVELDGRPHAAGRLLGQLAAERRPFTVVFATQPSVPAGRADRRYLLQRAVEHARAHPDRQVLVKLRSRPGEQTTHIEEQPYQRLARAVAGGLPPNCRLVYGHMGDLLARTDLLVTVSSTAALESLHRGVPTAVLTDLGVREALGNHYFLGSGCLTSWDALDAGGLPTADAEWCVREGVRPPDGEERADWYAGAFAAARANTARLAARSARAGLPLPAPYYTPRSAPGYLSTILARYGFDPQGEPRSGASSATRPSSLRRALRSAARGAYRHGVQRVAPVVRRLGEL